MVAGSQSLGQHSHKSKIVERRQAQKQPIIDFEKVMQVAEGGMRAAQAIAHAGYGRIIFNIFVVVDVYIGKPFFIEIRGVSVSEGIEPSVARISRGHGAIEKAVADASAFRNIGGMAHSQSMHRI